MLASYIALAVLAIAAHTAFTAVERETEDDLRVVLESLLATTHAALTDRYRARQVAAATSARDPELVALTRSLLDTPPEALHASPHLRELRLKLSHHTRSKPTEGFVLVGPNGLGLASQWQQHIGQTGLLSAQPEFEKRVWSGKASATPLVPSGQSDGAMSHLPTHSMLVGAPVRDEHGRVIAILALVESADAIASILAPATLGKKALTYVFTKDNVRFTLAKPGGPPVGSEPQSTDMPPRGQQIVDPSNGQPTLMAQSALAGHNGSNLKGYRNDQGVQVVGAWLWDADLEMGLAIEISTGKAFATTTAVRSAIGGLLAVSMGLVGLLTAVFLFNRWQLVEREEQLQSSRALLERAEAAAQVGHFTWDLRTQSVYWSPECYRIFGRNPQTWKVDGENFHDDVHRADRTALDEAFHRGIESNEPFEVEYRTRRGGDPNDVRWVHLICEAARSADGQTTQLVGIAQDVTERRELERSYAARTRDEAISQVTGGVAHHFNNLLGAIIGCLQILDIDLRDQEHREIIADALEAAEEGAVITRNLMAYSQHQLVRPKPINLQAAIEAFEAEVSTRLETSNVRLEFDLAPNVPAVQLDQVALRAALWHLVQNAITATPEGGVVLIKTRSSNLQAPTDESPRPYVEIIVEDFGVGMTPEVLEHAFDPFFTTAEVGAGAGLGLSQVYGFVMQAHGHIGLESKPGKGTRVTVRLPSVENPAPTPAGLELRSTGR